MPWDNSDYSCIPALVHLIMQGRCVIWRKPRPVAKTLPVDVRMNLYPFVAAAGAVAVVHCLIARGREYSSIIVIPAALHGTLTLEVPRESPGKERSWRKVHAVGQACLKAARSKLPGERIACVKVQCYFL